MKDKKKVMYHLISPEEYANNPHPLADWCIAHGMQSMLNDTPYFMDFTEPEDNILICTPISKEEPKHDFIFNNPDVHSFTYDDKQYWLAKDVARELGYTDTHDMVKRNVDPKNKILINNRLLTYMLPGWHFTDFGLGPRVTHATFITEEGIYNCLDRSRISQEAREYRNWMTNDVRPALRSNETYEDY